MRRGKKNLPLIIGGLLLLFILAVMLFPQFFSSKSPYNVQLIRFSSDNGKLLVESAPYPPSADFLLGSDDMGRDILSYIVYGTRMTILLGVLVAVGRFLVAIPLALGAGFGNSASKTIIRQANVIFSAIPALLISVIILQLDYFAGLSKTYSMLAFVLVLSLVGWPKLGSVVMERTEAINRMAFIRGEVAIGKKRLGIALENVLPHLAPELLVLFFMEIARALSMVMQLGIFSVFVGNLKIIKDSEWGNIVFYDVSFEPEWASMLSTSRNLIGPAPWAVIFPALVFFLSVLAFNLFGEGLRNLMQREDSRIVPFTRRLLALDVAGLVHMVRKKGGIGRTAILAAIILLLVSSAAIGSGGNEFSMGETQMPASDSVLVGSDEARETAEAIAETMRELGLEPLPEEDYIMKYELSPACAVLEQSFEFMGRTYHAGRDYALLSAGNMELSAEVCDATKTDLYSVEDFSTYQNKFVLIDPDLYPEAAINHFILKCEDQGDIRGVLLIEKDREELDHVIVRRTEQMVVVALTRELAEDILTKDDPVVSMKTVVEALGGTGNNVLGLWRGEDPYLEEEVILISMNYNYTGPEGAEILQFNLELMRQLCTQYEHKRSLIFMFLDGTVSEKHHGIYPLSSDFPYSTSKIKAHIDLDSLTAPSFESVSFSAAQAPFTRAFAWSMGHHMEKELSERDIRVTKPLTRNVGVEYYFTENVSDNAMFWNRGVATIVLSTVQGERNDHRIEELGSLLLKVISESNH